MEDTHKNDQDTFINHIGKHYNELQCKYKEFCRLNNLDWDWDIFQDTIIKCHDVIKRKGKLNDTSPQGIENFFFISFKNNIKREKMYARNAKRDFNVDTDSINDLYEEYYNTHNSSSAKKVYTDLFKDYATLYIMLAVEKNFDQECFYLFRLKTLGNMTYKQIREKTNLKAIRKKILEVNNWIKQNITKEQIRNSFTRQFGELLPE